VLDEGCVLYFKAPHSFTGEDVIEFQVHSSPYILKEILTATLDSGARLAREGEFTKRAFLNGKIDLTKAESIIDLIHAEHESAHAVALNHVQGKLQHLIQEMRTQLLLILEQVEGSIDFPDEVDPIDRTEILNVLQVLNERIKTILEMQDYGKILTTGINCVLVGRPNVGKSSLFNALLGEDRSIVTHIPGTTRDYIEGQMSLKGSVVKLFDTAGLRVTEDYIEHLGIQKIQNLITNAHLVLWIIDQSQPLTDEDRAVYEQIKDASTLWILCNKSDEPSAITKDALRSFKAERTLSISAETKEGLTKLKDYFCDTYITKTEELELDIICNVRQQRCLESTKTHLDALIQLIQHPYVDDLLSHDLKQALLALSEITGDAFTEEILDGIFSRFCVGK
jgi:tRNA modification GTPase